MSNGIEEGGQRSDATTNLCSKIHQEIELEQGSRGAGAAEEGWMDTGTASLHTSLLLPHSCPSL